MIDELSQKVDVQVNAKISTLGAILAVSSLSWLPFWGS